MIARADYTAPEVDSFGVGALDAGSRFRFPAAVRGSGAAERMRSSWRGFAALFRAARLPIVHIVASMFPGGAGASTCLGVRPLEVAAWWLLRIVTVQEISQSILPRA